MSAIVPGRVSIIIPAYNSATYLAEAIDSALAQTHPNVEVVVVNDGSTDNTPAVLDEYSGRIVRIDQENAGLSAARNRGILESSGEYLCFLDADDRLLPEMTGAVSSALIASPDCGLAYCGCQSIDEAGSVYAESSLDRPSGNVFETLFRGSFTEVCTVVARRSALAKSGLFDPALPQIEDHDMWMRVAYYYPVVFVPRHLAQYRKTAGSMSRNWPERKFAGDLLIVKLRMFLRSKRESMRLLRTLKRALDSHGPIQCIQDAFVYYGEGDYPNALRSMRRGVVRKPSYLLNRGVWSVMLKSSLRRRNANQGGPE